MVIKIEGEVEKINGKELSYSEFTERYMAQNKPLVLTSLMDHWRACSDWVHPNGKPNLPFFNSHFAHSKVQVADCGTREFTDQKRVEMPVSEFVARWSENSGMLRRRDGSSVLYLKDWHFVKEYPDYIAYTTPVFFRDDWLNMYLDSYHMHTDPELDSRNNDINCSDYRFVYMGEKGSWTPLHADVFRSYSWSANVCGKKRWLLLSPSQRHRVFDRNKKNCVYNIFDDISQTEFPDFEEASWLECIQEQNEIIFVPSGWYHQVHNLEDTVSINHNWFNRHNLHWVWNLLLEDYDEAKEYIKDIEDICEDFEGLCQRNLAANTGMNFYDFFIFLVRTCLANVAQLSDLSNNFPNPNPSCKFSPSSDHLWQNFLSIRDVATMMNEMKGLTINPGFYIDIWETITDPLFHKLYTVSEQTTGMIVAGSSCLAVAGLQGQLVQYDEDKFFNSNESPSFDSRVLAILRNLSSRVSSTEDLIVLINHILIHSYKEI